MVWQTFLPKRSPHDTCELCSLPESNFALRTGDDAIMRHDTMLCGVLCNDGAVCQCNNDMQFAAGVHVAIVVNCDLMFMLNMYCHC